MHWGLDVNLGQDGIKRKSPKAARNPDTINDFFFRGKLLNFSLQSTSYRGFWLLYPALWYLGMDGGL